MTTREYVKRLGEIQEHAFRLGVKYTWLPFEPYEHLAVRFNDGEIVVMTTEEFLGRSTEDVRRPSPPVRYVALPRLPGLPARLRRLLRLPR